MKTSATPLTHRNRLVRGGAALAGSATAALAAPITVVLDTPLVTDSTLTTAHPTFHALNVFSGAHIAPNPEESLPPEYMVPGVIIFGSIGSLDDTAESAKPVFAPLVVGQSGTLDGDVPFSTRFATPPGTAKLEVLPRTGLSTEISASSFGIEDGDTEAGGFLGAPYLIQDESSYNVWLTGESNRFFIPFVTTLGVDSTTYGWLEFALDAPSVSLSLLSYGYDNAGGPIMTPDAFTPFTPSEEFVYTPVPEPASFAVGAALVAGSATLFRRRRVVALTA